MASGMLVNSAAAMSAPQWYTSPRTSAIGTPRLTVILFTELMNVRAYTNSCSTSVKLNTTTVKIPGTISRGATFRITARRLYPSRSEEHTSELQSQSNLVCRLLLEKKKKKTTNRQRCRERS